MSSGEKAFFAGLMITFLNIPLALLLRLFAVNVIGVIMTIVITIELVAFGMIMLYMAHEDNREYSKNAKLYIGRIQRFKRININGNWHKAPIVSFDLNGRKHEVVVTNYSFGGIYILFLKNKKIKIFYDKDDPAVAKTTNKLLQEIGILCLIAAGLFILNSIGL